MMESPSYALQVAEDLLSVRDSLNELSLILKDYQANQDAQQNGPALQLAKSILDNIRQQGA